MVGYGRSDDTGVSMARKQLNLPGMAKRNPIGAALPEELDRLLRGFQASRILLSALQLDLFSALGGKWRSPKEVAVRIGSDRRGTEILLNALHTLGLVRRQHGRFLALETAREFLAAGGGRDSRLGLLHLDHLWHVWSTLTEAVKKGGRVGEGRREPRQGEAFVAAMEANARLRAPQVVAALHLQRVRRVLDLGGGSGAYTRALIDVRNDLDCTILDLPEVLPLTRRYLEAAGLLPQVHLRAGDMRRDDCGSGYDLVLLNAICHMFSAEENQALLHKVHQLLRPGGQVVIQDFLLNDDRDGPPWATLFAVNMLVNTAGGNTYTAGEFKRWLRQAGFVGARRRNLPGPSSLILARRAQ